MIFSYLTKPLSKTVPAYDATRSLQDSSCFPKTNSITAPPAGQHRTDQNALLNHVQYDLPAFFGFGHLLIQRLLYYFGLFIDQLNSLMQRNIGPAEIVIPHFLKQSIRRALKKGHPAPWKKQWRIEVICPFFIPCHPNEKTEEGPRIDHAPVGRRSRSDQPAVSKEQAASRSADAPTPATASPAQSTATDRSDARLALLAPDGNDTPHRKHTTARRPRKQDTGMHGTQRKSGTHGARSC